MNKTHLLLTLALTVPATAQAQTGAQPGTPAPATAAPTPANTAPAQPASAAQLAAEARDLAARARTTYPAGSANIDQTLWKEAAAKAEAAVQAAPGNPEVLRLRAQIYTEVGFWRQAELGWAAYAKVAPLATGGNDARAAASVQYNLGYAAYTRGQLPQAAAYFRSCLTFDSQSLPCATWAARTALEGGDYALAQNLYTQAQALAPGDKTLAYFAGVARNAGTYGPAATRAFSRAYAELEAGRRDQALAQFQEAARSAPNFADAQREVGRLALDAGDLAAASGAYLALTSLPGATASDRYNLGLVQEAQQVGLRPVQTFRAAYSKYAAGDRTGAESGFLQATTENPNYAKAWAWLGRVRYEAKNFAGAAEAYGRAVALNPNDKTSAYFLRLAEQGR